MKENLVSEQKVFNAEKGKLNPEVQHMAESADSSEDFLGDAEAWKESVNNSVKEVLTVGKELETTDSATEGVAADGEIVMQEIQDLREIDRKAEAIGDVVNEAIDSVASGRETSALEDLLSKVHAKILAIKTGVVERVDAFKEKREQKAQEKIREQENKQKFEIINSNPILLKEISDSRELADPKWDAYKVEKFSLDSLKLFVDNPYIKIKDFDWKYYPEEFNTSFTEENLKKFAELCPDKKEIPAYEFKFFCEKFSKAPQWIQEVLQEDYRKEHMDNYYSYGKTIKALESFDESKIALFKRLYSEGTISRLGYGGEQLNLLQIFGDKIDLLTQYDIRSAQSSYHVDDLKGILELSAEEIPVFQHMRQALEKRESSSDGDRSVYSSARCLEIFNLLKQADTSANVGPLFDWAYLAYRRKTGDIILFEEYVKQNLLTYKAKMAEHQEILQRNKRSQPSLQLIPEEQMTLGFVCERVKKVEPFLPQVQQLMGSVYFQRPTQLSEYIDSLEKDPISTLVEGGEGNGARIILEDYPSLKEFFTARNISFSKEDQMRIFGKVGAGALKPTEFPFDPEVRKNILDTLISEKPEVCYGNFSGLEQYLSVIPSPEERQACLDKVFEGTKSNHPEYLLRDEKFPLTPEQARFVALMKRISESQSRELKNLGSEVASIVAQEESFEGSESAIERIEKVFLRNNIPFVGKQFKIFEILYPDQRMDSAINSSSVTSLKENHSNNSRRLTIFKDLLHANFDSLNVNLEQYLHILKDGQEVLGKFESGGALTEEEEQQLLSFCKKINAASENVGREGTEIGAGSDEETMKATLAELRSSFGVREGETIVGRFERTFLQRIGIQSLEDALGTFEKKRQEADTRNREFVKSGKIAMEPTDLVKGIRSEYMDTLLDRGVFSPEFIGADTSEAKQTAKSSDGTPFDTDMAAVGDIDVEKVASSSLAAGYGDLILIMKDRGQFKDELELTKPDAHGPTHRGIRTGFGSTHIEGFIAKDIKPRQMEEIKFSIAKKGFYIPISDQKGEVIFSPTDFDQYRKIFAGVDRYHGGQITVDSAWKNSSQAGKIEQFAQTNANIESIDAVRKNIFADIQSALAEQGIRLNEGKYAESILGASISDTGSTGRGSALDEGYDFDFAVKLDDQDWGKVQKIVEKLSQKYSFPDHYNQSGMEMHRSKDFDMDGKKISLDVGFVKKSNVEAFDTNDAIAEKYGWIKEHLGEQAYLDAMTNIRFAKKTLKDAGCYKKGINRDTGQQGGLGGIGVEHWIMQNNGDAVEAFRNFSKNAYQDGALVPFEDFKKEYKIYSAGENIRNNMKAEDFMYNMDEEGYKKMAELSRQFS
jgi:hypothetical protein